MSEKVNRKLIYGGAAIAALAAVGLSYWLFSPSPKSSAAKTAPVYTFTTLEEAGYRFNDEQQLVKIADGS
jgi:hypothetical protein